MPRFMDSDAMRHICLLIETMTMIRRLAKIIPVKDDAAARTYVYQPDQTADIMKALLLVVVTRHTWVK
ncbi:hypothetical protein E4U55_002121 [Claviceps digitariae]|nr:hypothetical protein E4U55_002121 [Claviceps digitariae]